MMPEFEGSETAPYDFEFLRALTVADLRRMIEQRTRAQAIEGALQGSLTQFAAAVVDDGQLEFRCVLFEASPDAWRAQIDSFAEEGGDVNDLPEWLQRHSFWHLALIAGDDFLSSTMINITQDLVELALGAAQWIQDEVTGMLQMEFPSCPNHSTAPPLVPFTLEHGLGWRCVVDDEVVHVSQLRHGV